MGILADINVLVTQAAVYTGYPPTNAPLPHVVHRPLVVNPDAPALDGSAMDYDFQTTLYCAAGSVEASFNLALAVAGTLQGARVGGTTLSTSIGYTGVLLEGVYESQITVQLHQGGI